MCFCVIWANLPHPRSLTLTPHLLYKPMYLTLVFFFISRLISTNSVFDKLFQLKLLTITLTLQQCVFQNLLDTQISHVSSKLKKKKIRCELYFTMLFSIGFYMGIGNSLPVCWTSELII